MDIRILELLASKICHDLISPIGAIGNGIEFLNDMGADALEDASDLISMSAAQASAKLQAYRIAYGAGGADSNHTAKDIFERVQALVGENGKIKIDCTPADLDAMKDSMGGYPTGYCKILMMASLMALDTLPKGGRFIASAENGITTLSTHGENAGFKDGVADALSGHIPLEDLHPKHIHAHVCALMGQHYGYALSYNEDKPDTLEIQIKAI